MTADGGTTSVQRHRSARREGPPRIIGHRGAAASAPENTLAGFRRAAALGARWVEFDVRLTRDGRCILLHDDTLERTTDGRGAAARMGFAEIRRLDAGSWFAPEFRGELVPSLEEAIACLGELRLGAVVELKPSPGGEAELARAALAVLERHWPSQLPPPLITSFAAKALATALERAPHFARALAIGGVPRAAWRKLVAELDCSALHADHRRLDAAIVAELRASGLPLRAYTVNTQARADELFAWGVAGLFTDCPDRLSAAAIDPGI